MDRYAISTKIKEQVVTPKEDRCSNTQIEFMLIRALAETSTLY